jgi:Zn-dependent metalloprotease
MKSHHLRRWLLPLLVLGLITVPSSAGAALPAEQAGALYIRRDARGQTVEFMAPRDPAARLAYTPSAAEQGNPEAIARGFLDQNRALFGLKSAADELRLLRIEPDQQLHYAHVRLDQVYHGIPVFGRQLVVHIDPRGRVASVNGQFVPGIDLPTQPSIGAEQAEGAALRDLLENQLDPAERAHVVTDVRHAKTQLMVYVDPAGKARLTWYVVIMTYSPLGQWRSFVNAMRPSVVHAFDSLADAKRRVTYTADNSTDVPGRQLIDEGERSRDPVAQAAQDGAGTVYDYYQKTFKRDSIDGRGMPIVSTVHYGDTEADAENAAWIGEASQMVYGDGGKIFKPLAYGLDVIGHELTHGVTENTANLVYEGQSGALNEAYSDIFGSLIERQNWTIGEQVVKSPPYPVPYLRSLEDPTIGGRYDPNNPLDGVGQPATVSEYAKLPLSRRADNGGVHINSGIPMHAAFLVAQAIGREKMEQIYYRTLTQYLTPDSEFFASGDATVRSAQELYGAAEVAAVRQAFGQIGIDLGGSDTIPQPSGTGNQPGTPSQPPAPPPPPAPQQPAGCSEIIVNGGFESQTGWTEVSKAHAAIIDPELPHTGKRSAWLGGTDQETQQYIFQEVRLPANASSAKLSYYRQLHKETTGLLGAFAGEAQFSTVFANDNGDVVAEVEMLSSRQSDDKWQQKQFDVSQLGGKSLRLEFTAENPRGNVSSMFVDDVSLVVCTTGNGPAAPAPAASNSVYIAGTIDNADTGRGVEGAQVFVIKPGLSATQAVADDTITRDEVIATGTTDAKGYYQSDVAIPIGQTYSVVIIGGGFRPIVADDGVDIPSDASNPFPVDATLRRSR